jgi:hypothetical protein
VEPHRLRVEIVDEDCVRLWTVAFEDGQVRIDHDESDTDEVLRAGSTLWMAPATTARSPHRWRRCSPEIDGVDE